LIALGENAQAAVPALIALLSEKHPGVRYHAVFALRCLGPVASNALPALIRCLSDPEFIVRDDAVMSLGTLQQEPEKVVPILIEFIQKYRNDKTDGLILCRDAIDALRAHGEKAKAGVPNLLELLGDEHEGFRSAATNALFRIDPEAAAKAGIR
jgi:HEAT repeat protein